LIYTFDTYSLDTDRRELRRGGHLVRLEPQTFDLLEYLIRNREHVVNKDDLIVAIWHGRIISESTYSSRINAVRSAIGDNGKDQRLVRTLARKGVRFVGRVTVDQGPVSDGPPTAVGLPDKPSIAILPFANFGSEVGQNDFSDGITEDIITEVSRFSDLFVIAHKSSSRYRSNSVDAVEIGRDLGVRYILEGSVRRANDRVRITCQLIDAVTATHRWGNRYDRDLRDIFAVQDEVARAIATLLAVQVRRAELERALLKPPTTWQAHDYYLQAASALSAFMSSYDAEDLYNARRLLERSLSIETNDARAHALLADTYIISFQQPLDSDYINPIALDRAYRSAYQALEADPDSPPAHATVGYVLGFKRQHDISIAEFERAEMLNPNYTDWRFAMALVMAGDATRAIQVAHAHMRADPFYPAIAALWLGAAHYMLKKYSEALPHLREVIARAPNSRGGHLWSAANYAQLGLFEDARREAAEALRIDPTFSIEGAARIQAAVCRYREDSEHYLDGLRKAGLPKNCRMES
jgi:adenylate cyclase